jgi:hypothetical protein
MPISSIRGRYPGVAGDTAVCADDDSSQYRSHDVPAKIGIIHDADGAVGILPDVTPEERTSDRS